MKKRGTAGSVPAASPPRLARSGRGRSATVPPGRRSGAQGDRRLVGRRRRGTPSVRRPTASAAWRGRVAGGQPLGHRLGHRRRRVGRRRAAPPSTTTTSPRTSSAGELGRRPRRGSPRQTSSWSLVSSRATATGRSPSRPRPGRPGWRASRPGASSTTAVRSSCGQRRPAGGAARPPCGAGTPRRRTGRSGARSRTSAASTAEGPGTSVTSSPAAGGRGHQPRARGPRRPASRRRSPPPPSALGHPGQHLGDPAASLWSWSETRRPPAGDPGRRQQGPGPAGVLAADDVGLGEDGHRPGRQVAQVADRRGHEDEAARPGRSAHGDPGHSSRSPTASPQRSKAPARASSTLAAALTGRGTGHRHGARCTASSTARSSVEEGDVEGEAHPTVWTERVRGRARALVAAGPVAPDGVRAR